MNNAWYASKNVLPPDNTTPHVNYLFEMINNINGTMLDPADFTVGTPSTYQGNTSNADTSILLFPIPLSGYVDNNITIFYNRIDIAKALKAQTASIDLTNAVFLADIIPQINSAYGLDLLPTDYYNTPLPIANPATPGVPLVVTIATTVTSLKYRGVYDYIINYTYIESHKPLDLRRLIVNYSGLTNLSDNIIKYYLDGTRDTNFNFANNVTNISGFNITTSYYQSNGNLIVNGTFSCTVNILGIATVGIFSTLVVDQTGTIISALAAPLYKFPVSSYIYTNRHVPYIYALVSTGPIKNCLTRYTNDGAIDTTFNYSLNYIPSYIVLADNGNIYTVSSLFSGPDPLNGSVNTIMTRIDRILPNGSMDQGFTPLLVKSSEVGGTISNIVVLDVAENASGMISVMIGTTLGVSAGTPTAVINGVPLVPVDNLGMSVSTWIPVASLLNNGMLNPVFNNSVNLYSGASITSTPTVLVTQQLLLNYAGQFITWLTYKQNPITAIESIQPFRVDATGNIVPYESVNYSNWPVLSTLYGDQWYSDGTLILAGELAALTFNGIATVPRDVIAIIDNLGNTIMITDPVCGVYPSGTISINNILAL